MKGVNNMIHAMLTVRNESGRWLEQLLFQLKQITNRIVVVDDASTDDTAKICKDNGCEVHTRKYSIWGTDEQYLRSQLFHLTTEKCKKDDWIICLDADELLVNEHIPFLKYMLNTLPIDIDSIGFRLHDMWSDTHFRDDELWQAHFHVWPMIIRYKENYNYEWQNKKLHCGRFPANSSKRCIPTMIPIKHMGWSKALDRQKKYDRYMEIDPLGVNGILSQYRSIMDETPILKLFGSVYHE